MIQVQHISYCRPRNIQQPPKILLWPPEQFKQLRSVWPQLPSIMCSVHALPSLNQLQSGKSKCCSDSHSGNSCMEFRTLLETSDLNEMLQNFDFYESLREKKPWIWPLTSNCDPTGGQSSFCWQVRLCLWNFLVFIAWWGLKTQVHTNT